MRIGFTDIPESGLHCELSEGSWLFDAELERSSPLKGTLLFTRQGQGKVAVSGQVTTTIRLQCDRCLGDFENPVGIDIELLFEVPDGKRWHVKELTCTHEDLDTVLLEKPEIDVDDLLRQQILLALPEKKLCRDSCKGLCSICGANHNIEPCACHTENTHTPLQGLAKLKYREE